jgi:hypothetical protein
MHPFATLMTKDEAYDNSSNLDRPGVYRLNLGVGRATYRRLFGDKLPHLQPVGVVDTGHDFTVLDQLIPHPIYAPQAWVSILSPSDETFRDVVEPLLAEAYARSVRQHEAGRTEPEA